MGPKKYATAAVFRREPRFSDKIICNYFKVFTQVIASAKDDKAKQVFPREWDLAYIALPMVCQREQHRPTLEPEEVESILSKCERSITGWSPLFWPERESESANCSRLQSGSTSPRTAR